MESVEKSFKYIKRWYSNDKWNYEYPAKYKNSNRTKTKIDIAKETKLITGIKPLQNVTEAEIDKAIIDLSLYAMNGKLKCPALGNHSIYVESRTQEHIKNTRGFDRSIEEINHKAKYIPFIEPLLKYGKICEKSSSKQGVIYGIIGQVEYFDTDKNKTVKECVELAINFDSQKRKFIFSFADKTIKKSLQNDKDFAHFSAEQIPDTETVCITVYSLLDSTKKSTVGGAKMNAQKEFTDIVINITNITESNKKQKLEKLENLFKSFVYYKDTAKAGLMLGKSVTKKEFLEYQKAIIPKDKKDKQYNDVCLNLKHFDVNDSSRLEKAIRTMSFALDVPLKASKGEAFMFKAQEDLTNKWCACFSKVMRNLYDMVTHYFSLPEITVMSKSDILTYKGKVLYSPETGEAIPTKQWEHFVKTLETFFNKNLKDSEKRIILQSHSLGKLLNRMAKYNTFDSIKNLKLDELKYHGKTYDWISDSVKNMKNVFGESLTRAELAKIEVMQQSAGQRITKVSDSIKNDVKQVLIDGIKNHKSRNQVSQDLFDKMVGCNRDFQRIADTEIQNTVNNANVNEIVYNTPKGKPTYLQRIEIVDNNTCPYCKKMNGVIAKWSSSPLANENIKDNYASVALWDGKEWNGKGHCVAVGAFHPYCRGSWIEYNTNDKTLDAITANIFNRGKKWNNAVNTATKEFNAKGIKNPSDSTKGFLERINELMSE